MGTSLTGLTPATTYDALIKVGDNGPLSATAKYLSDGLGNDSPLAMSTTQVGIGNSSPAATLDVASRFLASSNDGNAEVVLASTSNRSPLLYFKEGSTQRGLIYSAAGSNNLIFQSGTTEAMRITSAGNVGIGTTTPLALLSVGNTYTDASYGPLRSTGSPLTLSTGETNVITRVLGGGYGLASTASIDLSCAISKNLGVANSGFRITAATGAGVGTSDGVLTFNSLTAEIAGTFTSSEKMRISSDSYLRLASGTGGIQFNGDTAAANALDDYEEGTWTPTTATTGYTISASNGSYTKIGRQVSIRCQFTFSAVNASSTSAVTIGGLPFTNSAFLFAGVIRESDTTGAIYACVVNPSSTNIFANSMDGVSTGSQRPFGTGENYVLSVTYFV